jgi:hypothetical protein
MIECESHQPCITTSLLLLFRLTERSLKSYSMICAPSKLSLSLVGPHDEARIASFFVLLMSDLATPHCPSLCPCPCTPENSHCHHNRPCRVSAEGGSCYASPTKNDTMMRPHDPLNAISLSGETVREERSTKDRKDSAIELTGFSDVDDVLIQGSKVSGGG